VREVLHEVEHTVCVGLSERYPLQQEGAAMLGQAFAAYVVAFATMSACGLIILTIAAIVRRGGAVGE
jgi:hypothetical protein